MAEPAVSAANRKARLEKAARVDSSGWGVALALAFRDTVYPCPGSALDCRVCQITDITSPATSPRRSHFVTLDNKKFRLECKSGSRNCNCNSNCNDDDGQRQSN